MEINPTNTPNALIKANIIEPLKTGPTNTLNPMIGDEEQFFPAHEEVVLAQGVVERERGVEVRVRGRRAGARLQVFGVERAEGREARPVLQVDFGRAVECWVRGEEGVVRAY